MQICKVQYVHFLQKQKTANSAAHLRPGRDTQPNNEVHLASVLTTSGIAPQPNSKAHLASVLTTSGIAPQPNSKAHLASVPPTLPASLPSQTAKRIWRPSLPTSPGSHTLPGGCPPRGPRRGNVNRGMKSLNRYAPLGAHL